METANQLLAEIQKVKATRTAAAGRQTQRPTRIPAPSSEQITTAPAPQYQHPGQEMRPSMEGLRSSMDNMQIRPVDAAPVVDYGRPMPPMQQPPGPTGPTYGYGRGEATSPAARIPPGARVPEPPMPFEQQARYQTPESDGYPPAPGYGQVCFLFHLLDNLILITYDSSRLPISHSNSNSHNSLSNPTHPSRPLASLGYLSRCSKFHLNESLQLLLVNSNCSSTHLNL